VKMSLGGGDWSLPEGEADTESPKLAFRRTFLRRLPVVAPVVIDDLKAIVGDPPADAIREWGDRWHLAEPWIMVEAEAELRRISEDPKAYERSGRYGAFYGGGPHAAYALPFTEKELTPPLTPRLPAWDIILVPRSVYRAAAGRMGADKEMLDVWLGKIEHLAEERGLVRAPAKKSHAHFDALIRWQCLEWPWDCITTIHHLGGGQYRHPRPLQKQLQGLADAMGLTCREGRSSGRVGHNAKDCPCSRLIEAPRRVTDRQTKQ